MSWSNYEVRLLKDHFEGQLFFDESQSARIAKRIYATDASVYQVKPAAVAIPATSKDIKRLIQFAIQAKTGLIPRGAGTSLAGQVVGDGIVMEISSALGKVISLNKKEKSVWIEPGIVRDDLNKHLASADLFFGPETSTANRALLGGMLGNNSCGLHSIVWGNVRDHILETRAFLSDGTEIHTHPLTREEFYHKTTLQNLEGKIYREIHRMLNNPEIQTLIKERFPKKSIKRRNTGYALDALLDMQPFSLEGEPFNLSKLIAGSEGTLAVVHSMKLNLLDLPQPEVALICIHCHTLQESLQANITALKHPILASELVDDYILSFTEGHPNFEKDRGFIEGKPAAILMVEMRADTRDELDKNVSNLIQDLNNANQGYAFPILWGNDIAKGWDIRKAGLGLIRNLEGDTQPVNLIEDCAVDPADLPAYVAEIQELLARHETKAAYYAHAGAGELHIEPFINLKSPEGIHLFRSILAETVEILKKYKGSLSGEHGDGRLRGEFIPELMGKEVYSLFKEIKHVFDPHYVFNPGKITDSPPMDTAFRFTDQKAKEPTYYFDYGVWRNPLGLAEKCSGSGDCKKTALSGGTMCPSYMATLQEKDSTRARANILRQLLSSPAEETFSNPDLHEILDLCLSCKGCQTECPSGVDMGKLKAETLQQSYLKSGVPLRTQLIGNFPTLQRYASYVAPLYNFLVEFPLTASLIKVAMGFAIERSLPAVQFTSLETWFKRYTKKNPQQGLKNGLVYIFADEFTNHNEVPLGQKTIKLLNRLGYGVEIPSDIISGRSFISKGMLVEAKALANSNVEKLQAIISPDQPLIGIEPSALLTFRDEIPALVDANKRAQAEALKPNCLLIDEFIAREFKAGKISINDFHGKQQKILLHGHCHQKSIAGLTATRIALSIPSQYEVELLPTGCCGMAGSFGYEKKHYKLSQQIANLVLFPRLLNKPIKSIIASNGTSCRHQIKDGIEQEGLHTAEILYNALK
ncbi:FAD-binding and (Fe-S)-binding domain-containing protein [Aquirufa novilacunae]|jgi:FAD/FMN-containing dehydrogenase/Fe-S oxidoreductase|uniref:FAD-linked oxidase C-terminal domain-containing protein n=1 Tax=Aquirufa novilacunae TaxID=3139305 RepID=A0ABW8TZ10_9BACT